MMQTKTTLKTACAALLLFQGTGAIYGGWNLMRQPDGSCMQLSLKLLEHSPFTNYLVPGVVLFIANGLLPIIIFVAVIVNYRRYALLVTAQGVILTGWIAVQLILLQTANLWHLILGLTGIALIVLGWRLAGIELRHSKKP